MYSYIHTWKNNVRYCFYIQAPSWIGYPWYLSKTRIIWLSQETGLPRRDTYGHLRFFFISISVRLNEYAVLKYCNITSFFWVFHNLDYKVSIEKLRGTYSTFQIIFWCMLTVHTNNGVEIFYLPSTRSISPILTGLRAYSLLAPFDISVPSLAAIHFAICDSRSNARRQSSSQDRFCVSSVSKRPSNSNSGPRISMALASTSAWGISSKTPA